MLKARGLKLMGFNKRSPASSRLKYQQDNEPLNKSLVQPIPNTNKLRINSTLRHQRVPQATKISRGDRAI